MPKAKGNKNRGPGYHRPSVKSFFCPLCRDPKPISQHHLVYTHFEKEHGGGAHFCRLCNQRGRRKWVRTEHMCQVHPDEPKEQDVFEKRPRCQTVLKSQIHDSYFRLIKGTSGDLEEVRSDGSLVPNGIVLRFPYPEISNRQLINAIPRLASSATEVSFGQEEAVFPVSNLDFSMPIAQDSTPQSSVHFDSHQLLADSQDRAIWPPPHYGAGKQLNQLEPATPTLNHPAQPSYNVPYTCNDVFIPRQLACSTHPSAPPVIDATRSSFSATEYQQSFNFPHSGLFCQYASPAYLTPPHLPETETTGRGMLLSRTLVGLQPSDYSTPPDLSRSSHTENQFRFANP